MNTLYYGDNLEILRRSVGVWGDADYEIVLIETDKNVCPPPRLSGAKIWIPDWAKAHPE